MSLQQTLYSAPIVDEICLAISKQRLPAVSSSQTAEEILNTAYDFEGIGIYRSIEPSPRFPAERVAENKTEYAMLANTVAERNPKTVLEIGTARGGTLFLWSRFFNSLSEVISIDLGSHIDHFEERTQFFEHFANVNMEFLIADSQTEQTRAAVERNIKGPIDFLFIDGDHSYEGVKSDFEMYHDLVADDGIIAFHDIVNEEWSGVGKFWREIKSDYDTTEIVEPPGRMGIGVVE